jgi:ABC-type bacteriocin/lantibiotic exporter with double-glycine peptidase domain
MSSAKLWAVALATALAFACGGAGCAGRGSTPRTAAAPDLSAEKNWTVVPGVKMVQAQSDADCGAAALRMVLTRWSPHLDGEEITRALGPVDSSTGYRAGMLRNVARANGLQAFVIEGQVADLVHEVRLGRPVIVGVVTTRFGQAYTHYQVVAGAENTGRRLLIADPRGTWTRVDADELLNEWRPAGQMALVVFP